MSPAGHPGFHAVAYIRHGMQFNPRAGRKKNTLQVLSLNTAIKPHLYFVYKPPAIIGSFFQY
jgi:hypothetical protein